MEQTSNHISVAANITWKVRNRAQEIPSCSGAYHGYNNVSLFSSSLLVLQHEKLNFTDSEYGIQSTDDASSKVNKLSDDMEHEDSFKEFAQQVIGTLLPDDEDELLAGIMDDFELNRLPSQVEELEEYNLFGSSGGMELDSDPTESLTTGMAKTHISDNYVGNGTVQYNLPNGVGTFAGEHPYGEHPSRTLFVRNISSNVEDSELQSLFEKYGDIRSLYTACKHRGFVMMSYYDIRAARTAMRALQNKPLRRRKLDIHFSIPKVNLSDKDLNQGTLVVFNLDPSVSNDDLHRISRAYGEVKETRETPHKRQHKFIEFYDVRAAEAAVGSLNKSDITGKRIKLEPSRPGGARWNLMQQLNPELEHDETRCYRPQVGSPITKSPPGTPQRCCWQPLMKITRNKCNVGYAFINMLSPSDIISFYQAFNGKRWDKFNSEQVASLAYARIQGKAALVAHFQNSSLMNEDKCCPILINSEGPESGDQESSIPNGTNKVLQQDDTYLGDMSESPAKNKPNEKLDDNSLPGRSSGEE